MLIEASRGGHANVANLLLRQPRYVPRKAATPELGSEPQALPTQPQATPTQPQTTPTQTVRGSEGRERKQPRKTEPRANNAQVRFMYIEIFVKIWPWLHVVWNVL